MSKTRLEEQLMLLSILANANRERGGITLEELAIVFQMIFDCEYTSSMIKDLVSYNQKNHVFKMPANAIVEEADFSSHMLVPKEIKREIRSKKHELNFLTKIQMVSELIKANQSREGVNAYECIDFLSKLGYESDRLEIKRIVVYGTNIGLIDEECYGIRSARKNFSEEVHIPEKYVHEFNLSKDAEETADVTIKITGVKNSEELVVKTAEETDNAFAEEKEGIDTEELIYLNDSEYINVEEESKWDNDDGWDEYDEGDVGSKLETSEEEIEDDNPFNKDEIKLSQILGLNLEPEITVKRKLYLDSKLLMEPYIAKLYYEKKWNASICLIKDIINKFGGKFKIIIFESDLLKFDSNKKNRISASFLKFFATAGNELIQFVQGERPSESEMVEYCKKENAVLVSGNEEYLALATISGIETYIPQIFRDKFPNPCKGTGVCTFDSNSASKEIVEMYAKNFASVAISSIQFEELSRNGYLVKLCAYYGRIVNTPEIVCKNKDRTIVQFCYDNDINMLYSKDYCCIAFAYMLGVPCTRIPNNIDGTKNSVEELLNRLKSKSRTEMTKIRNLKGNIESLKGRTIYLDVDEIYGKIQLGKHLALNGYDIELKNSNFKNAEELKDGGYISVKTSELAILIQIVSKTSCEGKIISARRI